MSDQTAQTARLKPYPTVALPSRGRGERDSRKEREEPWEMAIFGDLTEKQSELMERLLQVPRNSRGTIFFDSGGGSIYTGLALATLIRMRGLDPDGVVAGECSSAALMPLAACKRRWVTPHSTLLFHPVRWQSDEDLRFEEAEEWARHFKFVEADMDELLTRMFGIAPDKLLAWTRPGKFVTGPEMVEAGLAKMIDLFAGDVWSQIERAEAESAGTK